MTGNLDINALLAFAFGVVFLSIMLGFAAWYPNPTPFQVKVFMTALASAAAGIGAVIPGYLDVEFKGVLRAGGAMAMFAIVWFSQPVIENTVVRLEVPSESPEPAIDSFLADLDDAEVDAAYADLDPATREKIVPSITLWRELYDANVRPLGRAEWRRLMGVNAYDSPSGFPVGLYRQFSYIAKYSEAPQCRQESVTVRATQDKEWRVYSYQISPIPVDCPPPGK